MPKFRVIVHDPSFIWEQIEHLASSVRNYIDQT